MITGSLHNEEELLKKVAKGNEQAFRLLFDHYRNGIYTFALKMLQDEAIAAEIVQETFVKVWINRSSVSDINNFASWLYILARNITFNTLKRQAREKRLARELRNLQDENNFTEDIILHKEYQHILNLAVESLPPQQKMVYQLSKDQGLKREEIATRLKLSPETVKVHLALAMKFIRNYIKNYDTGLPLIILSNLIIYFRLD